MKIIECVPNISEGWSRKKVLKIAGALTGLPGVKLLDICMDRDHHRSVLTFIGPPDAVRQRFVPVNELIMRECMAESYKATLRSLDAELRREAAAW